VPGTNTSPERTPSRKPEQYAQLPVDPGWRMLRIRAETRRGDHFARLNLSADADARYGRAAEIARALGDRVAAAEALARMKQGR